MRFSVDRHHVPLVQLHGANWQNLQSVIENPAVSVCSSKKKEVWLRFTFDLHVWNIFDNQWQKRKKEKILLCEKSLLSNCFFKNNPNDEADLPVSSSLLWGPLIFILPDCFSWSPEHPCSFQMAVRYSMSHYDPAAARSVWKRSAGQRRAPAVQLHFTHLLSVQPIWTGDFSGAVCDAPGCPQPACKHWGAAFTCALVFAAAPPSRPRRSLQTFYMAGRMFRRRSAWRPDGFALNCNVY